MPDEIDDKATVGLIYGFFMSISTLALDGVPAEALERPVDSVLTGWDPPAR